MIGLLRENLGALGWPHGELKGSYAFPSFGGYVRKGHVMMSMRKWGWAHPWFSAFEPPAFSGATWSQATSLHWAPCGWEGRIVSTSFLATCEIDVI